LKFGKTVFELLKAIRSDQNLSRIENTGLRTIQSLAKTSARSGSAVQFEYRKSFMKEEIFFKIQPHETSKLQAKITEIKRHSRKHLAQGSVGLSSDLARLARSGEMTMLATIANVLVAKGQRGLVNEIANELDAEGHVEAAAILRDAADQVRRRPNPPLLR
jgi:hypothetical protein